MTFFIIYIRKVKLLKRNKLILKTKIKLKKTKENVL